MSHDMTHDAKTCCRIYTHHLMCWRRHKKQMSFWHMTQGVFWTQTQDTECLCLVSASKQGGASKHGSLILTQTHDTDTPLSFRHKTQGVFVPYLRCAVAAYLSHVCTHLMCAHRCVRTHQIDIHQMCIYTNIFKYIYTNLFKYTYTNIYTSDVYTYIYTNIYTFDVCTHRMCAHT